MKNNIQHTYKDRISVNPGELLKGSSSPHKWVSENTAMLIVHGIGNQLPMETLDQFGRGLIKGYAKNTEGGIDSYEIEHRVEKKNAGEKGGEWFDNIIRIRKKGENTYIDLYEYYWAHYTEDQTDWEDIKSWISGVLKGAKKFYDENKAIAEKYEGKDSTFFKYHDGQISWRYTLFINGLLTLVLMWNYIKKLLKKIPFVQFIPTGFADSISNDIANVVGDVVAYNVTDAKSKYYQVRRSILDGAVKAIKYIIEKESDSGMAYPSVIIAGHSLGSQVTYDAINRINFLVNNDGVANYNPDGNYKYPELRNNKKSAIKDQLKGYITFGSPLDKIAFFLRENIPKNQFLRQQLIADFLAFKQRDWVLSEATEKMPDYFSIKNCTTNRLLDSIKWRNYHDKHDAVSGPLDYYKEVVNVDCDFKGKGFFAFTHSNYWEHDDFYDDIIREFLN